MIAGRLAESVLFLEARCSSDADREYSEAIRRVIEEHALMRETLEQIRFERNIRNISKMASSALRQTAAHAVNDDLALRENLAKLAELLPSDEQIHEILVAKSLIRKVLE